jgi:hypothetical protein
MNWKESYNDICAELQMMKLREFELRKQWEAAQKAVKEGKLPSSIYCHIDLVKGLELYDKAAEKLNECVDEVMRLEGIKRQYESYMDQFTGLSNVILSKQAQGYSLKEIAAYTGHSYGHIRNLAAKHDKVVTTSAKAS